MRTGEPVRGPAAAAATGFLRHPRAAPPGAPGTAGPRRESRRSLISGPHPLRRPHRNPATHQKERCERASPCEGRRRGRHGLFALPPLPPTPRPRGTAPRIAQEPN